MLVVLLRWWYSGDVRQKLGGIIGENICRCISTNYESIVRFVEILDELQMKITNFEAV